MRTSPESSRMWGALLGLDVHNDQITASQRIVGFKKDHLQSIAPEKL